MSTPEGAGPEQTPLPSSAEQEFQHIQNAEAVVNEVENKFIAEAGKKLVDHAEVIVEMVDESAATIGDDAEQYAHDHDLQIKFMREMESVDGAGVAKGAEAYLFAKSLKDMPKTSLPDTKTPFDASKVNNSPQALSAKDAERLRAIIRDKPKTNIPNVNYVRESEEDFFRNFGTGDWDPNQ